uniref:Uncharacterized protein n=1 Tax=Spironucleus salmonicida TaxID=348837 RepID=V6LSU2_9EUKA|eukprot:EST47323.1 Hypothetical protein SS50377_12590 [Spironucleus salmonicida]
MKPQQHCRKHNSVVILNAAHPIIVQKRQQNLLRNVSFNNTSPRIKHKDYFEGFVSFDTVIE